jgi:hypothetical protein
MHGRRLIDTFQLEVDNSFGPLRELHPAIASHPLSSSKIMADILSSSVGTTMSRQSLSTEEKRKASLSPLD